MLALLYRIKFPLVAGLVILLSLGILVMLGSQRESSASGEEKPNLYRAYALYKAKCLACHYSVADPEKAGKTRDEWSRVVNVMHKQGIRMNDYEKAVIVDLLDKIRHGLEKDPG